MARHVTGSSLIAEGSNYHYKKFSSYFFTGILEYICTYFYLLGHANILNFSDQLTAESFAQIDLWFIFIFNAEGSMHKRRTNVEIFFTYFFWFYSVSVRLFGKGQCGFVKIIFRLIYYHSCKYRV